MNCPHCSDMMVEARASQFGEEYFYCRTCKKELAEILVPESPKTGVTLQQARNFLIQSQYVLKWREFFDE